jgi:non-specific serine/threonine protein kinase
MSGAQRDFLLEHLLQDPEADDLARRHADYYLNLAEQRSAQVHAAPDSSAVQGLQRECDNIRAALEHAIDAESSATGLRIAIAVSQFWISCGQASEGRRWIDRLLALDPAPASFDEVRLHALCIAADLAIRQGDYAQAAETLNAAAEHCREDTSSEACARVLAILGIAQLRLGDYAQAAPLLAEGTQRLRAEGDPLQLARALRASASLAANLGDLAEAVPLLSESQRRSAAAADAVGEAEALCGLGDVALLAGATAEAHDSYQDALNVARRAGDARAEAAALIGLGNAATNRDEAAGWRREALTNCLARGNRYCVARVLEGVAHDASAYRTPDIVPEHLLATATRLREQSGVATDALESILLIEHIPVSERDAPYTTSALNGPGHEVIEAVVHALSEQPRPTAPKAWDTPSQANDTLSRREREVVHYISEGLTNRQIAELLGIAERTVDSHVSNALRKLELKSRASIAAWVVARRMNGNRGSTP